MENLVTNAGPVTDASNSQPVAEVSQGYPVYDQAPVGVPQTPQEGLQNDAGTAISGQPTLTTPQEVTAATERLKQQNARNVKLLSSLGIDPLSDIGEQLEQGLITPEMIRNHIASKNQPAVQSPQSPAAQAPMDPVSQAQAEYEDAKAACDAEGQQTGQISFDTMRRYNEAAFALQDVKANTVTRQLAADQQVQQANENVDRVLTIARQGDYYQPLSDDVKQVSDFLHVAMTSALAYQEAPRMGLDPTKLTPKQYEYFANKAVAQTGQLAEQLIEMGRRQALGNISPNNRQPMNRVVPAGVGGTPVGLNNPYGKVNHTNHTEAARRYMAGGGQQV